MKHTPQAFTGNGSVTISSRIMKLLFVIDPNIPNDSENIFIHSNECFNQLRNVNIELKSTHPSYGTKTIIYKNSLLDLMEIASCNEGAIRLIKLNPNEFRIKGTVELSNDGSIVPLENEIFTLNVFSTEDCSIDIYSIDSDTDATTILEYTPVSIQKDAPTPVNVMSSQWLVVRKNNLVSLELQQPSGQKVFYTPEEVEQIVSEGNELSYNIDGLIVSGGRDLLCINVADSVRAYVNQSESSNVYVVNQKPL